MLTNAAKFDVDEKSLVLEIQQLGLPKENTDAIARQYRDTKDMLRNKFAEESYRVSKLISTDWRMDQIVASSKPVETDQRIIQKGPIVHMCLNIDTQPEKGDILIENQNNRFKNLAFEISTQKLDVLIHELTQAQTILQNMDS